MQADRCRRSCVICAAPATERRYFANNCVRHSAATAHVREVRHASVVTADAKQLALPKSRQCLFLDIRCSSARRENAGTLIRSAFCNEQSLFRSFSLPGRGHSPLIICALSLVLQNIAVQPLTLVIRDPTEKSPIFRWGIFIKIRRGTARRSAKRS